VVVPSIWFENSPLTIQEAQIAGVPVITSNQGGMAELVRDGVDGLHFRLGDPDDLYRVLASVVDHPERLESLRRNAPSVPTIEEQAASLCEHYRSAGSVALA
jgi:glycosyltransferase involved in cell wall biosynthesis